MLASTGVLEREYDLFSAFRLSQYHTVIKRQEVKVRYCHACFFPRLAVSTCVTWPFLWVSLLPFPRKTKGFSSLSLGKLKHRDDLMMA